MGFSPGDFDTLDEGPLHFERKDGGRIVLWSLAEDRLLFEVDLKNAALMVSQLETLLATEV